MSDLKTRTLASQYATSPTVVQMIDSFSQQISPAGDFSNFLSYVWDLDTAQGFGLDILGRIVQLARRVTGVPSIFGFPPAPDGLYTMNDEQYRRALKVKALANISNGSALDINTQLREFAAGRGNAFVEPVGVMQIKYNFYYAPEPYEYALIAQYAVVGIPAGVGSDTVERTINPYLGFSEGLSWQPFDRGVFANY